MSVGSLMTNYKMRKVFVDSLAAELARCFGKSLRGGLWLFPSFQESRLTACEHLGSQRLLYLV